MVHFVGAGCGAADLITVRGARLLSEADVVIYAGSLVNPELLKGTKEGCEIHDSARMTLPEVLGVMERAEAEKKTIVRLHTGDPSLYGAIREQMDRLEEMGIAYDVCPGVSSFNGASGGVPDGDHHPDGRADGCAGKRELPVSGGPSLHHGGVFKRRAPGGDGGGA